MKNIRNNRDMKIIDTYIKDLKIIQPSVIKDERGYFFESYNKSNLLDIPEFVQDNQSCSHKEVIRGLHFQKEPYAQAKLIRVISGSIIDVAVDIRLNSITYGKHFSINLTGQNNTMLYIPKGFAHGFSVMENNTIISYKCSNIYNKESEDGILWNDPDLHIDWKVKDPIVSEKDKSWKGLRGIQESAIEDFSSRIRKALS